MGVGRRILEQSVVVDTSNHEKWHYGGLKKKHIVLLFVVVTATHSYIFYMSNYKLPENQKKINKLQLVKYKSIYS